MLIYNLISYNIVCNTNTTTNANEIKALTRVESEKKIYTIDKIQTGLFFSFSILLLVVCTMQLNIYSTVQQIILYVNCNVRTV